MADSSWRDLETWDRVKWARTRHYESALAAAEAMGMKDGTYRCYERGPDSAKFITLDYKHARKFAREFRVRWEWLLDDNGEPWLTPEAEPGEDESENPERPTHYLRAWREYRGFTVAELAKKSGVSPQSIIEMEQANDHSTKKLGVLATALGTTTGYLLEHDPHDISPEVHETFAAIPVERRGQALEILKTFRPYQKLR